MRRASALESVYAGWLRQGPRAGFLLNANVSDVRRQRAACARTSVMEPPGARWGRTGRRTHQDNCYAPWIRLKHSTPGRRMSYVRIFGTVLAKRVSLQFDRGMPRPRKKRRISHLQGNYERSVHWQIRVLLSVCLATTNKTYHYRDVRKSKYFVRSFPAKETNEHRHSQVSL